MTRHRTITGFVAVALLAVAATAATMRSHSPEGIVVPAGTTMSKGLTVGANEIPTASFDERWSAMSASKTDTPERQVRSSPSTAAIGLLGEIYNGRLVVGRRFRVTGADAAARTTG